MQEQLLPGISSPADLRALDRNKLPQLVREIRETLIASIEKNGGHMASNLGVVELTIALHLCFDSPRDALVWDVSHQCYTHKLLTGRAACFDTLRQSCGLSGFTCVDESEHDHFTTGHSSTSVSAALGIAEAKRLAGDNEHYAVAILGDGALTGGLVYEALNNAGRSAAKLIVVLNDNEMSISRNVGGLSRYLAKVRSQPEYRKSKQRVERGLRRVPGAGNAMAGGVFGIKKFVKRVLTDTTIFEQLGLDYIGPVEGHDIDRLCAALESARLSPRPTLVHVHTTKGKGYPCAEDAPEEYHGVSGHVVTDEESYTDMFARELCALAAEDDSICAVTAAMAIGTGLSRFAKAYSGRFFDVGIAESHALVFAAGLARQGLRPVVALYATFLQRGFDQLLHDIVLQKLPMTIAVDRAGFVGSDGATHHGLYDVAMCAAIPAATVYAPVTAAELRGYMRIQQGLTLVRYARDCVQEMSAPVIEENEHYDIYGEASAAAAIVTYGRLVFEACKVSGVKILRLKRVLPIDDTAVEALLGCKRVCFFEEGIRSGGVGEAFGAKLLERGFMGTYSIHAVEGFARHAPVVELLAEHGLDAAAMRRAVEGGDAA